MESGKGSHRLWAAADLRSAARGRDLGPRPRVRRRSAEAALLVLALVAVIVGLSALIVIDHPDRPTILVAAAVAAAGALIECLLVLRRWWIGAGEASPGASGLDRRNDREPLLQALAASQQESAHRRELASAVAAEAEQQTRTLELLNEAVSAISGVLEPDTLDRVLCRRASELLGGVETLLVRRLPADGRLIVVAHHGSPPCGLALTDGGPVTQTLQAGRPVLMAVGSRSVASVPLGSDTPSAGVLVACSTRDRRLGVRDLRLLALLASHAAPAMEAARLYAELVGAHRDLTRANEELTVASRHKSDFLASVSHEVRTPLNSILGFSELLLDSDVNDPARRTAFLRNIHRSGLRLLALINDILDLAKVEAGQMRLRVATIDLADTIAAALATMGPLGDQDGVELVADCPSPLVLRADDDKVQQMLFNLLSNAIRFTPHGGRVTVRARQDGEHVLICVADTGIGIAKQDQERIFDEFQQVDGGGERRRPGTGLGLTLTRRLVELHGGRVWVESEVGAGSRFFIELPRSGSPGPPPSETRWPLSS